MLTIRAQQMAFFESSFADTRDQLLAEYGRTRFPSRFDSRTPEQMTRFCGATRALAAQLGVEAESDVATVLDLIVMYGPRFHELQWTADVFGVAAWSGAEKMNEIRRRVRRTVPDF